MTLQRYKRLMVMICILCVGSIVFGAVNWYRYNDFRLRSVFANEQTEMFDIMRQQALQQNTDEASACLNYVIYYYPSGTKQKKGSTLDLVVERSRASAVKDIVSYLRRTSATDLGDDPDAWLRAHADLHR